MENTPFYAKLLIGSVMCFCSVLAFAATPANNEKISEAPITKPIASIQGNPIGKKDSYTLNSNKASEQTVECVFINSGDKATELSIWTNPTMNRPTDKINLSKGHTTQPFQLMKSFHLKLANHWWCRTALSKKTGSKWPYCAYLSVSDATITNNNPFNSLDKTIHASTTSYNCRVKKPGNQISFFHYR